MTETKPEPKQEKEPEQPKYFLTYYDKQRLIAIRKFPECVPQHNFPDCPYTIEEMERYDIDNCVRCPYGGTTLKRLYDCLIIKEPDRQTGEEKQ